MTTYLGQPLENCQFNWAMRVEFPTRIALHACLLRHSLTIHENLKLQPNGLLEAYVGWRKCAKAGNAGLVPLQDSSGLAEGVNVGGICSGCGELGAGHSQKAVGKVM